MAKAQISTKDGAKITIEGTPDEVAALVARLDSSTTNANAPTGARHSKAKKIAASPINLVAELIEKGFFKKPKELNAIKLSLEERGHYYPVTTLSPTLLRLVRKRQLRRIKDNKRWVYVG